MGATQDRLSPLQQIALMVVLNSFKPTMRIFFKEALKTSLKILVILILAGLSRIAAWLTTFVFIRTEESSEIGYDGASIWHSGLPFRFLTRDSISVGYECDWAIYWVDAGFWFVVFLSIVDLVRYRFRLASEARSKKQKCFPDTSDG